MSITVEAVRWVYDGNPEASQTIAWTTPNSGNMLKCGYGGQDDKHYYTSQIRFKTTKAISSISLNCQAGNKRYSSASHPLRWGISSSSTQQLNNKVNSEVGTVCGNMSFEYTHQNYTFTKTGLALEAGTYYITIWGGYTGDYYGDYTEIYSYSNYPLSMTYAEASTSTITYNANGGTGTMAATTYVNATSGTTTLRKNAFTRAGHDFLGWSQSPTDTVISYSDGQNWNLDNKGNYTLYAVWKPHTYTVSYDANGGTGAPNNQTKTYGVDLPLSTVKPTRDGYTFKGWSTSKGGSIVIAAGESFTYKANSALTLYAAWELNTYTISYDANGGTGAPESQTKTHGTALTLSQTKPTKTDSLSCTVTYNANGGSVTPTSVNSAGTITYNFKSWNSKSDNSGISYSAGASYTAEGNATLYAQYDDIGSAVYDSITLLTPTRNGYNFLGWATNDTATQGVIGNYTPTAESVTLYAIWEAAGLVYIDNGTSFDAYQIYIDNGSSWDMYIPYIDNGSNWDMYS